jgi:hypothetical protein
MTITALTYTRVGLNIYFFWLFVFDRGLIRIIIACTEQGAYQVAPKTGPSLISRVLQKDYTSVYSQLHKGSYVLTSNTSQEWCTWAFPPGKYNKVPATPDLDRYNLYGGWSVTADRLAHIDGGELIILPFREYETDGS